ENITGEQFVKLLEALRAKHPDTEKFILYLDNARYYSKPCVKEWLAAHREFRLVPLPAYSPNPNLIERLWKFRRKKALNRWHRPSYHTEGSTRSTTVYKHLEWLRSLGGPPILTDTAGKLGDDLIHGKNSSGRRFASIPAFTSAVPGKPGGMLRRQCTAEYKID